MSPEIRFNRGNRRERSTGARVSWSIDADKHFASATDELEYHFGKGELVLLVELQGIQ